MAAGRPPLGPKLVENLDCSEVDKIKARTILETVSGEKTVAEACELLGVGETRFREMRENFLVAGLVGIAPKPKGRPRKREETPEEEVEALKKENAYLKKELEFSRARTVLATAFPHIVKDPSDQKKTDPRKERRRKRKAERKRKKR
jgi:hypothetical protein